MKIKIPERKKVWLSTREKERLAKLKGKQVELDEFEETSKPKKDV